MTIQAGYGGGELPAARTGGGWGGFFAGLVETGQGAISQWWEDRLDTEVTAANLRDQTRLELAGLAAGHSGNEEIDNQAGFTGERVGGLSTVAVLGVGALVLGLAYLSTRG